MARGVDWNWVREWCGRIFLAAFPLSLFAYLGAAPILRPGGVLATLPGALLFAAAVAIAITLVAGAILAAISARRTARASRR